MKVAELPLDTWVVVEPVAANEVVLLSTHATQGEAESERDKRNGQRSGRKLVAMKALTPIAGAQGCVAGPVPCKRAS